MELNLNYEGFEESLLIKNNMFGGIQYVFRFDNGFGASVVKHLGSYGHEDDLWELAVISFDETGKFRLRYDTDITYDVIGYLADEEIQETLEKIKNLNEEAREI